MKKKSFLTGVAVAVALSFASCQSSLAELEEENLVNVTFRTSIPLQSRALSDEIASLQVYDIRSGKLHQSVLQDSEDADFGQVTFALPAGEHELIFTGNKMVTNSFSYPTFVFEKVMDTFTHCLTLDVGTDKVSEQQTVTLTRNVAAIRVVVLDAVPAWAKSVRMTVSSVYHSFDGRTSFAVGEPKEVVRTFELTDANQGQTGVKFSVYTFVPEDGMTTDVKVEILDSAGNVLSVSQASDVQVEQNRQTVLSGSVFGSTSALSVQVNTEWGEDITGTI